MLSHWELYLQEVIRGQRSGLTPTLVKSLLIPLSWLFQLVVNGRNWFYDQGWLRCYNPPVRAVISIGNIVAGGTGKTPVTLMLAKKFYDDFSIALVSRGYRSPAECLASPLVLCDGSGPRYSALYCGDEPYLLAQHLPRAYVYVGRDKRQSARLAAHAGVDMIFLDDGMQHRRLVRDFDVVVLDAEDPFGKGYFLPRGFLREGVKALARAHLIIINHVDSDAQYATVKEKVMRYTSAPVVGTQWHVAALFDLFGNQLGSVQGKKIGMFCGIAQPDSFRKTLVDLGAIVVEEDIFPDHLVPDSDRITLFATLCAQKGAECIVCTEKDRVKLDEKVRFCIPIIWVQMELQVIKGIESWNTFIENVQSKLK